MERVVSYDAPSFIFTYFSGWEIEKVFIVLLIFILLSFLVLQQLLFRKLNIWVTLVILIFVHIFASNYIFSLYPTSTVPPGPHGKLSLNDTSIQSLSKLENLSGSSKYFIENDTKRIVLLRGVNLSGASKMPTHTTTSLPADSIFFDHVNVTFVGRPMELKDADEHFRRLSIWGFTFIRLLTTWEAIEHKGPGIYDYEYLEYFKQIIKIAAKYNISCFVDFHQDVWSRWTGGDGAPGWTLDVVGFNITNFHESHAAYIHQKIVPGTELPRMCWPTNYGRLAPATMFTLFYGGNTFAPNFTIEGKSIQDYLQDHFLNTLSVLLDYVKDEWNVIGFDVMNEPNEGYVGVTDLRKCYWPIRSAYVLTGFQSLFIPSGFSDAVDFYSGPFTYNHTEVANANKLSAWKEGSECIWKQHGVWDIDPQTNQPVLKNPDYFATNPATNKPVNFLTDLAKPFYLKAAKKIFEKMPRALVFIEPTLRWGEGVFAHTDLLIDDFPNPNQIIWAPHFYDGIQLFTKSYRKWATWDIFDNFIVFSAENVEHSYTKSIFTLSQSCKIGKTPIPALIGEVGIAMDMNATESENLPYAYVSNDFYLQSQAANGLMRGLENNLISFTWWNYSPDNSNVLGDLWNQEDLSIFSAEQITDRNDIYSGGRAIDVIIRPYARKTAGVPKYMSFDAYSVRKQFTFEFAADETIRAPTEIFIPHYQYPDGIHVSLSHGTFKYSPEIQTLFIYHEHSQLYVVIVTSK